jgi:ectoine hydroxylase-related dioxygenase (phytanoyl-CoA dioxygenase family)
LCSPRTRRLGIRQTIVAILGKACFAVRGILFNKTPDSNWKVVWHQDRTIAVRERKDTARFGPWSVKAGVPHVQPPASVMARMLAVRLHLDESHASNGPLRVIPGSHSVGCLSPSEITTWKEQPSVTCTVPKGGAILMRPLLVHASSVCSSPEPRRVIHLEFAAEDLPDGLEWFERV